MLGNLKKVKVVRMFQKGFEPLSPLSMNEARRTDHYATGTIIVV